jgi:hypothetical protein
MLLRGHSTKIQDQTWPDTLCCCCLPTDLRTCALQIWISTILNLTFLYLGGKMKSCARQTKE